MPRRRGLRKKKRGGRRKREKAEDLGITTKADTNISCIIKGGKHPYGKKKKKKGEKRNFPGVIFIPGIPAGTGGGEKKREKERTKAAKYACLLSSRRSQEFLQR